MAMGVLMRMIGPMPVRVAMHYAGGREFILRVRVRPFEVPGVIVPVPLVVRVIVGNQQTLAMMPAVAEDIIVLFAPGSPFLLAEAVPFAVRVLLDALDDARSSDRSIAGRLEKEAVVDVHQAIETELLIDPADFLQQLA